MFKNTNSGVERLRQIEYLKTLIKDAFSNFDKDGKGFVKTEEISSIMRYLGQFPSEAQVSNYIVPELQEDEQPHYISYEKFEKYMINVLIKSEFEPDDAETILAAFRILDSEQKGYIEVDAMKELICSKGIEFRPPEWDEFSKFAVDSKANVINYEDYVSRLILENEKHMDSLIKGYENINYPLYSLITVISSLTVLSFR